MTASTPSRRTYLQRAGAVLATVGIAGCSADDPANRSVSDTTATTNAHTNTGGKATTNAHATTSAEPSTTGETETTCTETTPSTDATTTADIHPGHDYDTTEVRAVTPDGERLGSVTAAIADTPDLRYLGLSDTESLPGDRGMLFVYDRVRNLTFVMRRMSFGIDIVYADDAGVITSIHHAPAPEPGEDGNDQEYPGRGQYVLEVNYGWTTCHGVETGDVLAFEV